MADDEHKIEEDQTGLSQGSPGVVRAAGFAGGGAAREDQGEEAAKFPEGKFEGGSAGKTASFDGAAGGKIEVPEKP
jgi:hypothetical protein